MTRFLALALLLFALSAGAAQARGEDHGGGGDVRVAGSCGRGATSSLRVRLDDGRLEMRFRVEQRRGRGLWRITVVHEQRISSRATRSTTRSDRTFELRRRMADLPGSDTVAVHAWGPRGLGCRATATLPG